MGNRRFVSVLACLLIVTQWMIVAPVPATPSPGDPAAVDLEWMNSTDLINAGYLQWKPASRNAPAHPIPSPVPASAGVPAGASLMAAGPSAFDSIGPGDPLQAAIDATPDGGTIWLDPGIYHESSLFIEKNITIRSNATAGGNRANTIIDAFQEGRIFYVTGAYSLAISDLTLRNGTDPDWGGAILALYGGDLTVSNSAFENFSVTNGPIFPEGGAITVYGGNLTVTSSSFSNCSAWGSGEGGAIWSTASAVITSSIFEKCTADDGGAIALIDGGTMTVSSSTFRNCSARAAGAIGQDLNTVLVVTSSAFEDCSATGVRGDQFGGAIATDGDLSVTGSVFRNCTASGSGVGRGGAIYSFLSSRIAVTSSTFTNCSSKNLGGAITGIVIGQMTVTGSSFDTCSADMWGGAIYYLSPGPLVVDSSEFTGCSSVDGGAIMSSEAPVVTISNSIFTGCRAQIKNSFGYARGGAILNVRSNMTIVSSRFNGCSANYGGAISNNGRGSRTRISGSSFSDCTATGGGAVFAWYDSIDITGSVFSACRAERGGAFSASTMGVTGGIINVTSSNITGCSATDRGSVAFTNETGTINIHFSRIVDDDTGTPVVNEAGTIDAADNWWGSNANPSGYTAGTVAYSPWLVLGISAAPPSIVLPQTAEIRTNLTFNSDGTDTSGGRIFVPDAITNTFALVSGSSGLIAPSVRGTANGAAQATYSTFLPGTATISGTVDNQVVYITLGITQGTVTPAPTTMPDDDWPSGSAGASGGGGKTAAGSSEFPLMTVTVNIGGDSKAHQATVTGTRLSDLIVTGIVGHDPGPRCGPPPGIVFQYFSLEPARYETITDVAINFTVPRSWLDENSVPTENIVLYQLEPDCWEALPTRLLSAKDGTVYYMAESKGFSRFAIVGMPAGTTPLPVSAGMIQPAAPAAGANAPITTETTAPPAPAAKAPAGSSPFPLVPSLAVLCCAGLIGGGWYARRWWIRRQNPVLFRDFD